MGTRKRSYIGASFGAAFVLAAVLVGASAAQPTPPAVSIGPGEIGGTVVSPKGPEAGVWVIAETSDLPTKFAKIVVTDDQGRYLLPDLPSATYSVWVRGYGLVDSPKVSASPGQNLDLTAVVAPDPLSAAQYYPAGYWYSLLHIPDKSEFPGTGPDGNGISPQVTSQKEWIRDMTSGSCLGCHTMGDRATRELSEGLGHFDSSAAAWQRRVQSGQAAGNMVSSLSRLGLQRALGELADWTDRVAAGALPPAPPRPQGIERNVVVTEWDWADYKTYLHDEVSTDRRHPTVNAYGPIYGTTELSSDYVPVLDPVRNVASRIPLTVRDPGTEPAAPQSMPQPSPYYGDEVLWTSRANAHNPMLDAQGRLWLTMSIRPPADPDWCREGSSVPSAQQFPMEQANRQLGRYDPKTGELTFIDTCFTTHHLMFAEDADNTLWMSTGVGSSDVVGWFNTKMFDETGDEQASQGWTPMILDTNGDGQRGEYVEPGDSLDPTMDKRIVAGLYGASPAPDGSVWGSNFTYPGAILRITPGPNPPETTLTEIYQLPVDDNGEPAHGYGPRGMDVDRNGVVWVPLASGHLASFDRRKCQGPLNGPTATGQQCPEGWTFYKDPLPQFEGLEDEGSVDGAYYVWVDQFNTFGLGDNVPVSTANAADGLLAFHDGQWVTLRVPYPMGFYTKGLDGRIDDPNAGWKGRGLWATVGSRTPFHLETGAGTTSKVVHFQLRPDPLAK
ncbi:MAG TPA: carboxypeptidase-like regulatory domain-containing protein [Chloroflexota bacterium]|nr:carboxypeptidase-like regulatory domain-containing protein [Chloroflexota bacterium]